MAGAELALEDVDQFGRRLDEIALRRWIHLAFGREEQVVDAGGNQPLAVRLEGARILFEVLAGAKLQAVDEDGYQYRIAI